MKSAIYMDGQRFIETQFSLEADFEKIVKENSKTIFGNKTIYFDLKNKIDSKSLGASIPDGFLFDFKDKENPEFYLVEVELQSHDFYRHIFPQITKFFAFFKNSSSRYNLIEKLFNFIKLNPKLEDEFKTFIGNKEIYKALKDIIENSQNILLILDDDKPELEDIIETYTDTWDKIVKIEILKLFTANGKNIFVLNPDFEDVGFDTPAVNEEIEENENTENKYTESYHFEGVDNKILNVYESIKNEMKTLDAAIKTNPQKSYISFRKNKNFAFFKIKLKKMNIVVMLPYEIGHNIITHHKLIQLSERSQEFYNGPSFKVSIDNNENIEEIVEALKVAYKQQNK
jgi:predicted transport protein